MRPRWPACTARIAADTARIMRSPAYACQRTVNGICRGHTAPGHAARPPPLVWVRREAVRATTGDDTSGSYD
jgi:hypothetical protein